MDEKEYGENKTSWSSFRKEILEKPIYFICCIFIIMLSFLFDLTNRTVGVDDLARPIYFGDSKECIAATRWGQPLWACLLSDTEFAPFIDKFLSILFLLAGAILFSLILYQYFSHSIHKLLLCTMFSCLYISFPLINEIWNYNGVNTNFTGNAMLAAVCILLLYNERSMFSRASVISSFLLSVVVSSYESGAFLYVSAVLSVILMDLVMKDRRQWLTNGVRYAVPLIGGLVLRFAIGFVLIFINRLQYAANGATEISWNIAENLPAQIAALLDNTFNCYFARGLIYFPILMFDIALAAGAAVFITAAVRKKNWTIILLYLLLCCSLFFQELVQGTLMPYRTAQPLQYFTAFAITIFLFFLSLTGKRFLLTISVILCCFLCYRQGVFLNRTFALNNQRSDNEAALAHNIGYRLKSMYDDKPVIFVGEPDLGKNIRYQLNESMSTIGGRIYKKLAVFFGWMHDINTVYETDIMSVLLWNSAAYYSQTMMGRYFSYYGYDIQVWDSNDTYPYKLIAIEGGMKPGEIRDMGDYLLVFLG